MAELVNLRTARKRAARTQDEAIAAANRLAHGQPKQAHSLDAARRQQAAHILDQHRIEPGEGR